MSLVGLAISERYFVDASIAEGKTGVIYRAMQMVLQQPVAIKVVHEGLCKSSELAVQLHQDVVEANKVKSPHALSIDDFGRTPDQQIYLAMDLLEGETLAQRLATVGHIDEARCVTYLEQLEDVLGEMHELGLIHGHLRTDKIFVTQHRGRDHLRLLGVGTARLAALAEAPSAHSAPEQRAGDLLTARADVYSLAVAAYEMVTGSLPFADVDLAQLRGGKAPSVRSRNAAISQRFADAIALALEEDPAARPASISELVAALTRPPTTSIEKNTVPFGDPLTSPALTEAQRGFISAETVVSDDQRLAALPIAAGPEEDLERELEAIDTLVNAPRDPARAAQPVTQLPADDHVDESAGRGFVRSLDPKAIVTRVAPARTRDIMQSQAEDPGLLDATAHGFASPMSGETSSEPTDAPPTEADLPTEGPKAVAAAPLGAAPTRPTADHASNDLPEKWGEINIASDVTPSGAKDGHPGAAPAPTTRDADVGLSSADAEPKVQVRPPTNEMLAIAPAETTGLRREGTPARVTTVAQRPPSALRLGAIVALITAGVGLAAILIFTDRRAPDGPATPTKGAMDVDASAHTKSSQPRVDAEPGRPEISVALDAETVTDVPIIADSAVAPKAVAPKAEPPKAEPPKAEPPKAVAPKAEPPKAEPPKAVAPKAVAPKAEPPKAEPPKAEPPKAEPPKAEPPKAEPPKAEPPPAKKPPAKKPPAKKMPSIKVPGWMGK